MACPVLKMNHVVITVLLQGYFKNSDTLWAMEKIGLQWFLINFVSQLQGH